MRPGMVCRQIEGLQKAFKISHAVADHWQVNSASWCISAAGQSDTDGEQIKQLVTRVGQPGAYSTTAAI